ncbi:hypothetical protein T459_15033 [Capsicum annuum]|uniref:BAG domain-containing protein n=1 Tax=Capsicum annuum TaxID=4072 RepID=A0A2G2ZJ45_CAPAN|nr:hypothetical protein T459_15033 [Capsicum annuum]
MEKSMEEQNLELSNLPEQVNLGDKVVNLSKSPVKRRLSESFIEKPTSVSAYTLLFSVLTLWDYTKYGEVKFLFESLLMALDASLGHALLFSIMNVNKYRYVVVESFYKIVMAFSPVPDLHIMWLLHLCEANQEMQSWIKAAQCIVTVAGVVMQVASFGGSNINLSAWEDKKNLSESKFCNLYYSYRALSSLLRPCVFSSCCIKVECAIENQEEQALIGLLLRLDSVPGVDPTVRKLRRDLSRRIVRLQEILDAVSDTKIQNWDGF